RIVFKRFQTSMLKTANDEIRMSNTKAMSKPEWLNARVRTASLVIGISLLLALAGPTPLRASDNLGVLGSHPRWSVLEHYQRTITHDEFVHLLNDVYCTHGFTDDLFKIDTDSVRILQNREAQT